jgi:hypothetical protein
MSGAALKVEVVYVDTAGTDWEHSITLRPVRAVMAEDDGIKVELAPFHTIDNDADRDGRRTLYKALLGLAWLPPRIRREVMAELGRSPQREKRNVEEARTLVLQKMVRDCEARIKRDGRQPRGGRHCAALEEIAQAYGLTAETLEKRFRRLKARRRD